jgi:RNA polymerase sigma-70 factor (ECF subfamily)
MKTLPKVWGGGGADEREGVRQGDENIAAGRTRPARTQNKLSHPVVVFSHPLGVHTARDTRMLQNTLQPGTLTMVANQSDSPREHQITDLTALHTLYAPRLFRFLLLSTRDRDLAESLTQDTFLKLWRTRDSFRGDCALYTWITRIAISLLQTHTRTETFKFWRTAAATSLDVTDLTVQIADNGRSAEDALIARESLAQLYQAVEQLSDRQRTIFLLRDIEEMELNDIAQALSLPLPTVKTHLYRALDRVRKSHSIMKGASRP